MRSLALLLLTGCVSLGRSAAPEAACDTEPVWSAIVTPELARFVFPMPQRSQWVWPDPPSSHARRHIGWRAIWDASYRRPETYSRWGVDLQWDEVPPARAGAATLEKLVADATRSTLRAVQAGHLDAWAPTPESALRARVERGAVILELGRSAALQHLLEVRPDSVGLEFMSDLSEADTMMTYVVPAIYPRRMSDVRCRKQLPQGRMVRDLGAAPAPAPARPERHRPERALGR